MLRRSLMVAGALAGCGRLGFATPSGAGDATDGTSPTDASDATDAPPATMPLLWFKLDETTGNVANSGTATAAYADSFTQLGVAGVVGNAARLGNMNDGISFADTPALDAFSALTIEGWMKYDSIGASSYSTFVKKDGAYLLRTCDVASCGASKVVSFVVWDHAGAQDAVNSNISPIVGTWYHVAGVYDGTVAPATISVYWDGAGVGSSSLVSSGTLTDSSIELDIGRGNVAGENLTGELDDVKVWTIARTDAQICGDAGKTWTGTTCM